MPAPICTTWATGTSERCWTARSSWTPGRSTCGCLGWSACWGWPSCIWGSVKLVVAFVVGHVGATLLVAVGLTAAVELGWLPVSVSRATDVGMSYGAAAVLGALTAAIPRRWRCAWIGWWLAVGLAVVAVGRGFTDVGHAVALALGMLVSTRFGTPRRWTPVRYVLLGVAAVFGYLLLASAGPSMILATGLGLVVAASVQIWRAGNACEVPSGHRL